MKNKVSRCLVLLICSFAVCTLCKFPVNGQNSSGELSSPKRPPRISTRTRQRPRSAKTGFIRKDPVSRLVNLLIVSDPPNSSVVINDEFKGLTNADGELELDLPPRVYQIRVSREGYSSEKDELELSATPLEQEVEVKLAPLLKALKVTTDPPDAEVYLDDAYKGTSSATGLLTIEGVNPSQPHTLRAKKEGYPQKLAVTVPPNSSAATIKLTLDLITLKVITDPPETEVYFDDAYKGVSNTDGVLSIESVNPSQQHILRGRKEGYIKDNRNTVSPNTSQATIKLQLDPLVLGVRSIRQHISSGRLNDAFSGYLDLAKEKPDYEDLPRLLDSILQGLQAHSATVVQRMGPFGLFTTVEEAQEMSQLYEQIHLLRQGDSVIAGVTEYWKMKHLMARAQQSSIPAEKESILRSAVTLASLVDTLNAQNPNIIFDSAWVYRTVGDNATAKKDYDLTLKLNPNWAYPHFALGLMDMSAAEQEKSKSVQKAGYMAAIDRFSKAISVKADFFQAYAVRGISYAALKMHSEAIANGQQAVAMRPQSAYAHFALGSAYYEKGKPEYRNAMTEFEHALALKDDELDENLKSRIQQKLVRVKKSLGIKN